MTKQTGVIDFRVKKWVKKSQTDLYLFLLLIYWCLFLPFFLELCASGRVCDPAEIAHDSQKSLNARMGGPCAVGLSAQPVAKLHASLPPRASIGSWAGPEPQCAHVTGRRLHISPTSLTG